MSVICFGAAVLGNVAWALAPHGDEYGRSVRRHLCEALARVSAANAACYQAQYGEPTAGATREEIERGANPISADRKAALRTLALLDYNLVQNDGTRHGGDDTREALLAVLVAGARLGAEALESVERQRAELGRERAKLRAEVR